MTKLGGRFVSLVQKPWMKFKYLLTKCNDKHPVIFKITLAVLAMLSFALLFRALFGWKLLFSFESAALLLPVIYIHEQGHVWAMKKCGIAVRGVFFVPFLGAATLSQDNAENSAKMSRSAEAFVYLMGPVWGLVLGALAIGVYFLTGFKLCLLFAFWSVILNLFNLIPLMPMDGGGVVKAISFSIRPWFGFGIAAAEIIAAATLSYLYLPVGGMEGAINWLIIGLLLMMAIRDFRREIVLRKNTDRRPMSWKMIVIFTLAYFVSIAVLCGMAYLIINP